MHRYARSFRARLQRRFHIELEQMDSADPPLAVRGLYGGRYRQRYRHSAEEVHEGVGPLGGDPARLAVFHRYVLVRAAVCSQMAYQAIDPLNGRLAAGQNLNPMRRKIASLTMSARVKLFDYGRGQQEEAISESRPRGTGSRRLKHRLNCCM